MNENKIRLEDIFVPLGYAIKKFRSDRESFMENWRGYLIDAAALNGVGYGTAITFSLALYSLYQMINSSVIAN